MATLTIDRSTKDTSIAVTDDNGHTVGTDLGIWDESTAGPKAPDGLERIVVGIGPGSFAGIRSALAWAIGYALGRKCEVKGIISAAAFAEEGKRVAVIGDARRGKRWIALFDGFSCVKEVFQGDEAALAANIPDGYNVVSPDDARLGDELRTAFGEKYSPAPALSAKALARAYQANPALLVDEPLPVYLNPAVRD